MAKTAAERLEKFKHIVRVLSVFLVHYSRDLAIAQIPVPFLAAMELCTTRNSSKGQNLGKRPACDIVARQNEVGFSFWAESYSSDQCANQVSRNPSRSIIAPPQCRRRDRLTV